MPFQGRNFKVRLEKYGGKDSQDSYFHKFLSTAFKKQEWTTGSMFWNKN